MSASALIAGTLHKDPATRTSAAGNEFVTATVRFQQKNRNGETETLFVSVTAFRDEARSVLARLRDGDAVSIGGPLQVGIWDRGGRPAVSLNLVADTVAAARPAPKSKIKQRPKSPGAMGAADELYRGAAARDDEPFDDPVTF